MQAEARFLAETSKSLTSSLDYKATLQTEVDLAVFGIADFCIAYLVEDGRIYVAEIAHHDPAKHDIVQRLQNKYGVRPDRTNSVEQVIRTGKALLSPELTDELIREHSFDDEHFNLLRQLNLKSAMLVPLRADAEIFGTLVFLTSGLHRYEADDLTFAEEIARYAALAIHNARLYAHAHDAIRARDEVLRVGIQLIIFS